MPYLIGSLLAVAALAAVAIYRRLAVRYPTAFVAVLATLPILAGGAASGHWSASVPLTVAIAVLPVLRWVETQRPTGSPPEATP
jgi:hypothetical protein